MEMREMRRAGRRRRRALRWNAVASLVLAAILAGLLHYLAARHYVRRDWSGVGFYRLSPKTTALLDSLQEDIEATILLKGGHPDLNDVQTLLREYQLRTPRFFVARVDPDRSPARVEALAKRFPITEPNVVIFAAGDRFRIVPEREWIELEPPDPDAPKNQAPRRRAFLGEAAFTAAIQSLTGEEPRVVYFLEGHGEKSIESAEPGFGLSQLARLIRQDGVEARRLPLDETRRIPDDAAALVIAGPRRRLPQPAVDMIHDYLDHSGRVIVMLDSRTQTGLEDMLSRWGVRVGDDVVVDPTRTLTGQELLVGPYPDHPITSPLARYGYSVFYQPRSIEPMGNGEAADRPRATSLALTTAKGWAERDFDARPIRFDADQDRPGPIAFAVAVERGAAGTVDVRLRATRLVVFGDSQFVANRSLTGANGDFFLNALRWVMERHEPMGLAPKSIAEVRLHLTRRQMQALAAFFIIGWPSLFALIGVGVRMRRRH